MKHRTNLTNRKPTMSNFSHLSPAVDGYFEDLDGDDLFEMLTEEQQAKVLALPLPVQDAFIGNLIYRLHKCLDYSIESDVTSEAEVLDAFDITEFDDESIDKQIGYAIRDTKL